VSWRDHAAATRSTWDRLCPHQRGDARLLKIGRTDDLDRRLQALDWTNLPLPFECFYAAKVANAAFVEAQLHNAFEDCRVRARREFFIISPERVVAALRLAEIESVTPVQSVAVSEEVQHDLETARKRRAPFKFTTVMVPVGAVLTFTRHEGVTATVADATHVTFNGQVTSLSDAARQALNGQASTGSPR
jgi:hypothetical protein